MATTHTIIFYDTANQSAILAAGAAINGPGIVDLAGNRYGAGILDQNISYSANGILDSSNRAWEEGILIGGVYYTGGILDAAGAYHEEGIMAHDGGYSASGLVDLNGDHHPHGIIAGSGVFYLSGTVDSVGNVSIIAGIDSGTELRLNQYGDYTSQETNAINIPANSGFGDLTGSVPHLVISRVSGDTFVAPPVIDVAGAVVGEPTAPASVQFELTSADTAQLSDLSLRSYQYEVWAVSASGQRPILQATDLTVFWGRPVA
jgi:hypothetical protein